MTDNNGWEQYSLMVLKELETLSKNIQDLRTEMQGLKSEIAEIRGQQANIAELRDWKNRMDEVCSATQLKDMKKEVEDLRLFKTKAITVFVVVQFIMSLGIFWEKML